MNPIKLIRKAEAMKVDGITSVSRMVMFWPDFKDFHMIHYGKLRILTPQNTWVIAENNDYIVKIPEGFVIKKDIQLFKEFETIS